MNWRPKKSDKIEVRLPTEQKRAFLAVCRAEGRSASDAIRTFIEIHLARSLNPKELPMIFRSPLTYVAVTALAVAGVFTISAQPSQAAPDFAAIFRSLDADGDGRLAAAEFDRTTGPARPPGEPVNGKATLSAGFTEIDANKDAAVSLAEFEAFNRTSLTTRFLALDANSDGRLTAPELRRANAPLGEARSGFSIQGPPELFIARLDADKDGAVTEKEFYALP